MGAFGLPAPDVEKEYRLLNKGLVLQSQSQAEEQKSEYLKQSLIEETLKFTTTRLPVTGFIEL